nr:Serine threonine protein kinase-related domain containing protein [Haemonchus contortus]
MILPSYGFLRVIAIVTLIVTVRPLAIVMLGRPFSPLASSTTTTNGMRSTNRPSLSRKRAAASNLPVIEMSSRERSSLSLSLSSDVTQESSDELKRQRYGSSSFIDESYSSPLSNNSDFSSSEFLSSCGFACRGRLFIGGKKREKLEPLVNNSVIGDYRIVGAGKDSRAVHLPTNKVVNCQVLTSQEAHVVSQVIARLEDSERYYRGSDVNELRDMVMPAECELVEEVNGRVVMFVPLHECSLHAYAQRRSFHMTEADVEPIFKQIVRILAFCHALGIVVRNLKPRKLVFDQQNRVRLENVLDCIVCDNPSDDRMVDKYCTPAFAAPEVVNRATNFSGKACDVWSLGILLYLLLLGRYPFYDETPAGVFSKIRVAKVVLPPDVHLSAGARALIFGLLRRDPDERPTTAELQFIPWVSPPKVPCRRRPTDPRISPALHMRIALAQNLLEEMTEPYLRVPCSPPLSRSGGRAGVQAAPPSLSFISDSIFYN